jgi:hypothetical protein
MNEWKKFTDVNGDFQLANYIYKNLNDLMKHALDMGTLLSNDPQKLRAYKEQTKKLFKSRWHEIAQCLETFDIIEKCMCYSLEKEVYCDICKGSRYKLSSYITPNDVREVGIFVNASENSEIAEKLQKGLMKVIHEMSEV